MLRGVRRERKAPFAALQLEAEHAAELKPEVPDFAPGDTVRVQVRVREGTRERLQAYEGVCIARSGSGLHENFTVRKISYGEGVERVFPVYSPLVEGVEVVRRGRVRRAKLYYLRDRRGKSARIVENTGTRARKLNDAERAALAEEKARIEAHAPRGYLPIEGIAAYDKAVQELLFGKGAALIEDGRVITTQALGGTGAIFLGKESPVAIGDYFADPNHVLPTGGTARFASCLSVEDFMKRSNLVRMSLDFTRDSSRDVEELALGEGLPAHATSVALRRQEPGQARVRGGLQGVTPYLLVEEEGETKLNQNESPWDIPGELKDEVSRRLKDLPWNRYHQSIPQAFLDRIAADADLPTGSVLAASGSNLILQWIFEAYAGPGRSILVPSPSFSLYPLWAQVTESRLETVQLAEDLSYDADAILAAIRGGRPDMMVLCLPNNPTGSELETEKTREIAAAVGEYGGLLVIDEAYREFSAESFDRTALVKEFDNLVLVRTCSKAFSAAGMRLGYLLAPVALATELSKLVPPFHLGLFTAVLGDVLWENRTIFDERAVKLNAQRRRMQEEAEKIPGVKVFPSEANFFLFEVADAGRVHDELKKRGILIRRQGGSERLENCLRVNAGTIEENDGFLDALREIQG